MTERAIDPQMRKLPFELNIHGTGAFVVFETSESVGLPLFALGKATLRGEGGKQIVLEFHDNQVVIEGEGLAELFSHVLLGRAKIIRAGESPDCVVRRIHVVDT